MKRTTLAEILQQFPAMDLKHRKLIVGIAKSPHLTPCVIRSNSMAPDEVRLRHKFRGIQGLIVRIDATTPKLYTSIVSDTGNRIDSAALLSLKNIVNIVSTAGVHLVPRSIRVTWRTGDTEYERGLWTGGTLLGDYTTTVADRIPDDVLDYIRKHRAMLRLKIRLKDDGILIGWDVEEWHKEKNSRGLRTVLAGGDFRESRMVAGKILDQGWQNP